MFNNNNKRREVVDKTQSTPVQFFGPDAIAANRGEFYADFAKVGTLTKLYISQHSPTGTIYYANVGNVNDVIKKLREGNRWNLTFQASDNSNNNTNIMNKRKSAGKPKNSWETESNASNDSKVVVVDEIIADMDVFLYCMHGHKVLHLTDTSNTSYVRLQDLRCLNVELYEKPPQLDNRLAYNEQMAIKFRHYMEQQALDFMHRNQVRVDNYEDITAKLIDVVFDKTSAPETNGNMTIPMGNSNMNITPPLKRPRSKPLMNTGDKIKSVTTGSVAQQLGQITSNNNSTDAVTGNGDVAMPAPKKKQGNVRFSLSGANDNDDEDNAFVPSFAPLKYADFECGKSHQVLITHIDNDGGLYVQKPDEDLIFTVVKEASMAKVTNDKPPIVGKVYFAMYMKVWYRAKVLELTPKLRVQYIDYGNENDQDEPITELREIVSHELRDVVPAQAVKVRLEKPLKKTVNSDQVIVLRFVSYDKNGVYVAKEPETETKTTQNQVKSSPILNDEKPSLRFVSENPTNTITKSTKPTNAITSTKLDQPQEGLRPPKGLSPLQSKLKESAERKIVLDIPARIGELSVIKCTGKGSFTAFAYHSGCMKELQELDELTGECKHDPAFKPAIGATIAVNRGDTWVRGVVMATEKTKYKCALIDYGETILVDELCALPRRFADIFEYTCVLDVQEDIMDELQLKEGQMMPCEILKERKVILDVKGRKVPAVGRKWDEIFASGTRKAACNNNVVIGRPEVMRLQRDDLVRIMHFGVEDGRLFLQCRRHFDALKAMDKELAALEVEPLTAKPVQEQMVLHMRNGTKLSRAMITSISTPKTAHLFYVDLGISMDNVPITDLLEYAKPCQTYGRLVADVTLQGFNTKACSEKVAAEISNFIEKRQKFLVSQVGDKAEEVELKFDKSDNTLTQHLTRLIAPKVTRKIYKFNDLPVNKVDEKTPYKLPFLFASDMAKGLVAFCAPGTNVTAFEKLCDDIAIYTSKPFDDLESYKPQLNEVCLAIFDGVWYRAVINQILTNKYRVYFFDYGNFVEIANLSEVRPIVEDFMKLPPVALLCDVIGLKDIVETAPDVLEEVKSCFKEGSYVHVDIVQKKDYVYKINMELPDSF